MKTRKENFTKEWNKLDESQKKSFYKYFYLLIAITFIVLALFVFVPIMSGME